MYGSRVSTAIHGKDLHPPLHLGVVAIEKRAFRLLKREMHGRRKYMKKFIVNYFVNIIDYLKT